MAVRCPAIEASTVGEGSQPTWFSVQTTARRGAGVHPGVCTDPVRL
jgi:hypothetical protein